MTGKELKKLREKARLTQMELAVKLGVTTSSVYRWEKIGTTKIQDLAILKEIEEEKQL